jgi:hypothetical protein
MVHSLSPFIVYHEQRLKVPDMVLHMGGRIDYKPMVP